METHLKLSHIAPYLPYGLKLEYTFHVLNDELKTIGRLLAIDNVDVGKPVILKITDSEFKHQAGFSCYIDQCKPILRPMSDLITYVINDDISVYKKLSARTRNDWEYENPTIEKWSYEDILILLQNHFDVFGLIPTGLAVSIHDVEQVIT